MITNTFMKTGKVHPNFHGKKGRSGRKKSLSTIMKQAMDEKSEKLPLYLDKIDELALNGDREALFYLVDRIKGKAKQQTDINLEGGERLGVGMVLEIFKVIARAEALRLNSTPLIEEGKVTPLADSVITIEEKAYSVDTTDDIEF